MDTGLILIAIALLGTFHLMSVITLKNKLESLQKGIDKQKDYWKSVEYSIEIQSNQLSKEIQERGNFEEKALGHLTQCAGATSQSLDKIYGKIDLSTKEINKTVKEEAGRILFTPLKVRQV